MIDRYVGKFISVFLNVLVRLAGWLLRPDHNLNRPFKTIVVCKFKGIGSIIQATPLLSTLKKNYPGSRIIFVSTAANRAVLSMIPAVDEMLLISDQNLRKLVVSVHRLIFSLWKKKPGVYIDLEVYSNFSSLVTTLSLARNRMGYYRQSSHYRLGIYTHMMYYNIKAPVSQIYLQFARLLGCRQIDFELCNFMADCRIKSINPLFSQGKYILINPNTSDLRTERRWAPRNFALLAAMLCETYPDRIVAMTGSDKEKSYVDQISEGLEKYSNFRNCAGITGFDGFVNLTGNSSLLITNDSGPMHIAFACNTPVLALFGACSPDKYESRPGYHHIYKNVYCSPCVHEFDVPPCRGDNQCMKMIEVEEVADLCKRILQGGGLHSSPREEIAYTGIKGSGTLGTTARKRLQPPAEDQFVR